MEVEVRGRLQAVGARAARWLSDPLHVRLLLTTIGSALAFGMLWRFTGGALRLEGVLGFAGLLAVPFGITSV